jgi:hypothetical protein
VPVRSGLGFRPKVVARDARVRCPAFSRLVIPAFPSTVVSAKAAVSPVRARRSRDEAALGLIPSKGPRRRGGSPSTSACQRAACHLFGKDCRAIRIRSFTSTSGSMGISRASFPAVRRCALLIAAVRYPSHRRVRARACGVGVGALQESDNSLALHIN